MLPSEDSRGAHGRGQSVCRDLCEWARILVGEDAGDGPRHGRMVRWKRDAALKKVAQSLALVGAFSSKRVLECRTNAKTVDRRLAREDTRLSLVVIMGQLAPDIESAAGAHQGIHPIIGKVRVTVEIFGISRESGRNGPVGGEEAARRRRQRKQPGTVRPAKVDRARPDGLLVGYQILQKRHSQGVRIFDS